MRSEQLDLESAVARLGLATAPVQPPARVKERLLSSMRAEGEGKPSPAPDAIEVVRSGVSLIRTDFLPWTDHSSPGVRVKVVSTDPVSGTRCLLLQLGPGSVFPDHEHSGVEEVFVVSGSFSVAGQILRTGDFCRSEPGTKDWDITTEKGALLLVTLGSERSAEPPDQAD
ncbi:MAG: cupin domain-containing protein [Acidobacteria bacterium]|nr:cupin domain-containing protein [Acidobacteriota bacterium]MCA1609339.1 cupin domain-containing protein [Acidobacteriota bacterium]